MELIATLIEYEKEEFIIISTNPLTMLHLREFLKVKYGFKDEDLNELVYSNFTSKVVPYNHGFFIFHGARGTFRQIPVATR